MLRNPEHEQDTFRKSEIFGSGSEEVYPFITHWHLLEKSLQNIKTRLTWERDDGNHEISSSVLNSHLHVYGLELESDEVQQQLDVWHNEGFIELLKNENVYLRISGN